MAKEQEESSVKSAAKMPFLLKTAVAVIAIAMVGFFALSYFNQQQANPIGEPTGLASIANSTADAENSGEQGGNVITPSMYAVRQQYYKEAFKPKREEYNLFEKAAGYLKILIEKVPEYFSLESEEGIFADLPNYADDFGEIAYMVANGKYYAIGLLGEDYYKQPEFYPYFKEYGLNCWAKPDPMYWTPNGYGSYPAEQWTTIKKGQNGEFTAVVFFYSSWCVQTFQGVTLMPDSKSLEYFDLEITPQNFLLEPGFPKFYGNWVQKIVITGKAKPGTPPGEYAIGINVEKPPRDLVSKWEMEHKNIYFDAASGITPEGNQIQFNVTIE